MIDSGVIAWLVGVLRDLQPSPTTSHHLPESHDLPPISPYFPRSHLNLPGVLREPAALSQYSVEYGTALLMNLSLRTGGKARCEEPELDILSVLTPLTESESLQVRTYVNGTLYSVLVRASLKARAQELGLAQSLDALIEHSDETFARQVTPAQPQPNPQALIPNPLTRTQSLNLNPNPGTCLSPSP